MNEKTKLILLAVCAVFCACLAWYLFSVPSTGTTDDSRVEKRLDDVDREQRAAEESIRAVSNGLDESTDSAGSIAEGIDRSESHAESIAERNADAAASAERIAAGNESLADRIESAERADEDAAGSVAEAERQINICRSINRSSAEILRRYAGGISEKRESARADRESAEKQD